MANSVEKLFRENLKKYRKAKKITQVRLAVLAELSENYVYEIECGRKIPSLKTIARLAETLGVEVKDLFS